LGKKIIRKGTTCQVTLELKPIEPIKEYRWITQDEQKEFYDFMNVNGFGLPKLAWCGSEFEKSRCSVNYEHAEKYHYLPCGLRGKCPRCSMSYAHDRADTMYKWVRRNIAEKLDFDLKMNHMVLTLPSQLHNIETRLFSKMINSFVTGFGLEAYGYSVHIRHSHDPLVGRFVHGHVLLLNIKRENGALKKNQYYFNPELMRKYWKDTIQEFTGLEVEGEVNVNNAYASVINKPAQVRHWLAYLYRYPVQDLFNVQVRYGTKTYFKLPQFKNIQALVNEKKPRLIWCGLLSPAKRKELLDLLGMGKSMWINLPEIVNNKRIKASQCRDCGSPYEVFERGKYTGDKEPVFK